jgi:hypothetical protein
MCSSSLIYLLDLGEVTEEVTGALVKLTSFWTFTRFRRKQSVGNISTSLFPELTLKELVFLCQNSIFLLPQDASAL